MNLGNNPNSQNTVDRLKRERDRFIAFAFASADILMELDKNGVIRYADGATMQLLSKQPQELIGRRFDEIINGDDTDLVKFFFGPEARTRIDNVAIRLKTKMGSNFPFIMNGYKISELQGHYYLTFSTFRTGLSVADISRRDLNTGLLRRGEFCLAINRQLILSRFSEKTPYLTMFNLINMAKDNERDYTDNLAMPQICDIIKGHSVNNDTAGVIESNILGLVHFENVNAEEVKQKILNSIAQISPRFKNVEIHSVTVKLSSDFQISEEDSAQAIVYTINQFVQKDMDFKFVSLTDSYEEMVGETISRIAEFRQTVDDELFDMAFQPIVNISTGEVKHFEVLTRLRDARNFNNPFQFIEFGESVGIISDFDFKMMCRVIDLIRKLAAKEQYPSFAVNLSGQSLSSQLFMDKLLILLSKNADCCRQLMVEITESTRVSNIRMVNEYFKRLRGMGIQVSIDDFGTGEATFDYMRNLEVDMVKVDGSFVSDEALESTNGRPLLKAIGDLCKSLNVEMIGEKVENPEAAKMLLECGVKYAQGYFYAKPSTDEAILETVEIKKSLEKIVNINSLKE